MLFSTAFISITDNLIWIFLFIAIVVFILFLKDSRSKIKKVIFFGDSITRMGMEPSGYIGLIREMIARENIRNYQLMGSGIGGNKVYDLYLRMHDDVMVHSPEIVVIWIGVNDVWHKTTHGTGTDADRFEKFYRAIIHQLLANKTKVMLVTPAVIGEKKDFDNWQDADLNAYCLLIKNIAEDLHLPLCNLHAIFHSYEANNNTANLEKGILTTDGVHLNDAGNKLAAIEIWKVLKEML